MFLVGIIFLFGGTLGIVAADRAIRNSRSQWAISDDPPWGTIVLLTFLMNVVTLPYYFYKSRSGSVGWLFVGLAATAVWYVVTIAVAVVARMLF